MSTLHMISLPLDLRSFRQWAARRRLAGDEGRALHHLLSETFGKGAIRPFRLMVARGARTATLYGYTGRDRDSLHRTAQETGAPEALAVADPARLADKAMPTSWREGRRLAFDVRVRPVRRLRKPAGVFPKGAEVDAFLTAVLRHSPQGRPETAERLAREAVYRGWLAERLEGAARLDGARMVRFQRTRAERGQALEGPDATFHGELTVTDGAAFSRLLAAGVGRHAAYGYGMLLLRPAGG